MASGTRIFWVRVPSTLLKSENVSPDAQLLWTKIAAHADGHTGISYVGSAKLEKLMGCGRRKRQKAQSELVRKGWLKVYRKHAERGRWGSRIYQILLEGQTREQFEHCGETDPYISYHSQGQVRSITTRLTPSEKLAERMLSGDLT
jgi:hypothetical protein